MKNGFKRLLILGVMVGWGLQSFGAEAVTNITPQAGEWLKKAYLAVVEAELARADNHEAEAAKSYRAAIESYQRLQGEYPGWQAAMVNSRLSECQKALLALEMPKEPDVNKGKNGSAAGAGTNTELRLLGLLSELRTAQSALAAVVVMPSGDALQAKQLAADVDRLKDELNEATKDNLGLQRKIGKLEAKLDKTGASAASVTNVFCRNVVSAVKSEANRLMKMNDTVSAITLLMEAIELMPTESDLVVLLAVAECREGRFDDAVKLMTPFDVRRATNADALLTLGTAYMGMGEIGKARDEVEKALEIKPDYAEAHFNLAQILITIKPPDLPNAQEHYQRALELGSPADTEFENALKTALIISKMKKKSGTEQRKHTPSIKSEVRTPGAPTDTP